MTSVTMENSNALSQSMDSVNTAAAEEEVSIAPIAALPLATGGVTLQEGKPILPLVIKFPKVIK